MTPDMDLPAAHSLDDIERLGVYQVYTGTGTGSGFLIDANHLLTNCHVVQPYREVAIEMRDRSRIIGRVRRIHPHRDLAIVELARAVDGVCSLTLEQFRWLSAGVDWQRLSASLKQLGKRV